MHTITELTGNNAPLTANPPTLLLTIPFTSFTANANVFQSFQGKLKRNARARTFTILNTMDQPISSAPKLFLYDSAITTNSGHVGQSTNFPVAPDKTAGFVTLNGDMSTIIGSNVDSGLVTNLTMGATAPTTGNLKIFVTEVF